MKKTKNNKSKKKPVARKPAAKARTKPAPKKVSRPVVKAKAKPVKARSRPAVRPASKPVAKPAAAKPVAARSQHVPAKPAALAALRAAAQVSVPASAAPVKPVIAAPAAAVVGPKKYAFKVNDLIVYPAHGVGRVTQIEEQEIAGSRLELYIVDFDKEKLRLKVPTGRAEQKGMRRLADRALIEQAMRVLKGRARIKRTMWSRRAQEYDAKINSGDLIAVAEVVRDLYRSERQPEQSYSERQLFEQALERMAREIAAVRKIDDDLSIKEVEDYLAKNARRPPVPGEKAEEEAPAEEAA
jgi:CarD family transcriptional regulator, regulator of rRNA transcription